MLQFFKRAAPVQPKVDTLVLQPPDFPVDATAALDAPSVFDVEEGNEDIDWRRWDDAVALQCRQRQALQTIAV